MHSEFIEPKAVREEAGVPECPAGCELLHVLRQLETVARGSARWTQRLTPGLSHAKGPTLSHAEARVGCGDGRHVTAMLASLVHLACYPGAHSGSPIASPSRSHASICSCGASPRQTYLCPPLGNGATKLQATAGDRTSRRAGRVIVRHGRERVVAPGHLRAQAVYVDVTGTVGSSASGGCDKGECGQS